MSKKKKQKQTLEFELLKKWIAVGDTPMTATEIEKAVISMELLINGRQIELVPTRDDSINTKWFHSMTGYALKRLGFKKVNMGWEKIYNKYVNQHFTIPVEKYLVKIRSVGLE